MTTAPYTVVPGDTLYGVARRFDMSVDELRSANNLASDALSVGQVLQVKVDEVQLPTPSAPPAPPPPRPSQPPATTSGSPGSFKTYTVAAGDSMYKISRQFNVSVESIMQANNMTAYNLTVGQQLRIPVAGGGGSTTSAPPPVSAPTPATSGGQFQNYIVQPGDSLYRIGQKFGVSPEEIMRFNNLVTPSLSVGQSLRIPGGSGGSTPTPTPTPPTPQPPQPQPQPPGGGQVTMYTVQPGDSLYRIGQKFGVSPEAIMQANGMSSPALSVGQALRIPVSGGGSTPPPPTIPSPPPVQPPTPTPGPPPSSNYTEYRVQAGDSLYKIGQKFGVSPEAIMKANDLSSPALSIGQTLLIPGVSGPSTTPQFPPPTIEQPQQPEAPPVTTPPPTGGGSHMVARQDFKLKTTRDNASNCNRYELTVRLLNGQTVVAKMRDNPNSSYKVYPHGLMYAGMSNIQLDINSIASIGLSLAHAKALQYVSTHEGQYDAINSYDKAIFSYGFIQFVGKQEHGASLNDLMSSMKTNAGSAFNKVFERVGISCQGNTVTVLDERGRKLTNDQAWIYIQEDVRLAGPFIQAGFDQSLVLEQLRMANNLYVQPALKRNIDVNGMSRPLGEFILSEGLVTAVIAIAVSRGVGGMAKVMSESCSRVASQQGIRSADQLPTIDERIVCQDIANNPSNDKRVRDRAQGVLNEGLSFSK